MDVKIDILKKQEEIVNGRSYVNYTDYYHNIWATPVDLYGNELYEALNVKLENTIAFEVRYCKKIKELRTHCKDYVIRYEGEIYNLYATNFKRNEKRIVLLKANRQS